MRRHGWKATLSASYDPCDLFVQWGVRRKDYITRAKASGTQVCIIERGYIGDRFEWSSVSFGGGLNGRAAFRGPFDDASRWEKHFAHLMRPWRDTHADVALIMGQVPGDTAVANVDLPRFYDRAQRAFAGLGLRPYLRPHPNATRTASVPLAEDLAQARCVVTWNSNSGVDAVLAGVPTVAMDEGSMAWPVTGHALAMPQACDRDAWAHALAWKQFTKQEMASGFAAEAVGLASPH